MSEPTEGPTHRYDASLADRIEKKWQAHWEQHQTFRQLDPKDEGFDASRPKFYCLDMFPYPSGAGLHVGHPEGYTATDIVSRYKRMRGYNVLHPMGWDAFGLPAEQYAIKTGVHPSITTKDAINNFRRQLQRFGFSYDWSREFATTDPEYYRWTQWIFLKIYGSWFDPEQQKARPIEVLEAAFADGSRPVRLNPRAAEFSREEKDQDLGAWSALSPSEQRRVTDSYRLAYKAPAPVNWCPKLGTVLANEEVIDGRSERGDYPVYRKTLPQWTFRIAEYSDRFLAGLDDLDWPKPTKLKQTEWIGRSYGAEADFPVEGAPGGFASLRIYTTRPDTLFGATYMVVAPEHGIVDAFLANPTQETNADSVRAYVEAARNRSDRERQQSKDKTGVFSGHYATNPVNGERIPVWVADYVLMGYGHGAIMAVPAHDERDFEFAKKFDLRIVEVLKAPKGSAPVECFAGNGTAVNSKNDDVSLDGLPTAEAKTRIIEWLTSQGIGRGHTNYRLRDWVFSRQRYWGEPFPVVFDEEGHHHPVDEDALPLNLPELEDYAPVENDEPQALLDKVTDWITVTAGEAHVSSLPADAKVVRETNTMPGWAGSCWYHLRYCDPRNADALVSQEADAYWMGEDGVDLYVGGAEHAVLHLLYARFWHMVLYDYGYVKSPEPYRKLFHQGLIMSYAYRGPDKRLLAVDTVRNEGTEEEPKFVSTETGDEVEQITAKMSKNLKNVVNPDDVIADYGADTFRLYEMYMGPLETSKPWNTRDISGMHRFLQRAWRLTVDQTTGELRPAEKEDPEIEKLVHRTIAGVTHDIERMAFNTAIAKLIELVNAATSAGGLTEDQISRFSLVLSPFAPHMAEELWEMLGQAPCVADQPWPTWDEAALKDETIEIGVQVQGKLKTRIQIDTDADKKTVEAAALADPAIQKEIAGKTVRKVIVVPGRLVNIVAN